MTDALVNTEEIDPRTQTNDRCIQPFPNIPELMIIPRHTYTFEPERLSVSLVGNEVDRIKQGLIDLKVQGCQLDTAVTSDELSLASWRLGLDISNIVLPFTESLRIIPTGVRFYWTKNGVVLLPFVADCLGLVAKSPEAGITACHLAIDDYSMKDLYSVLLPHFESSQLSVALVSGESTAAFRRQFTDFKRPDLPRTKGKLRRYIEEVFPFLTVPLDLFVKEPREERARRALTSVDSYCLVASTAEPGITAVKFNQKVQ